VRFFNNPISEGKHDLNKLFKKLISFKLDMFPKLEGMQPWNLLFAKTTTETGELPKLSGNSNAKRLSFMKIASRSLSKSAFGTVPSNSLNLISKNLRAGRFNTTSGNFPANLLLLRSNSKRSFNLLKVCGTVPQNLLEFMWKSARSTKRPSSSGK
jgi:hypothetical protein